MKTCKVLFVCLGNICRSPMAEYVFRNLVKQQNLSHLITVDSAGTSGWHDGEGMHCGTSEILDQHYINSTDFASRKINQNDFTNFDYLIVMDDDNLAELEKQFGHHPDKIFKLTDLIPELGYQHVPDPWYTSNFEETYKLVNAGSRALLEKIKSNLNITN